MYSQLKISIWIIAFINEMICRLTSIHQNNSFTIL